MTANIDFGFEDTGEDRVDGSLAPDNGGGRSKEVPRFGQKVPPADSRKRVPGVRPDGPQQLRLPGRPGMFIEKSEPIEKD